VVSNANKGLNFDIPSRDSHFFISMIVDSGVPFLEYAKTADMFMSMARKGDLEGKCRDWHIDVFHDKLISLPGYWCILDPNQWDGE
jgi:hypothetical protein